MALTTCSSRREESVDSAGERERERETGRQAGRQATAVGLINRHVWSMFFYAFLFFSLVNPLEEVDPLEVSHGAL